jgi:cytochrome b
MSAETDVIDAGRISRPVMVKVWDPLVRLFHWSLAGFFAFAFLTGDEWKSAHILAGYVVGGLVAFRILWGIVGPTYARFASFVRGPMTTFGYLRDALALRAPRHLGHNPAGGAMIVALLAALATIAATGYMMTTDAYWGVEWVEGLHKSVVYLTLGLIGLHIGGVVLASLEYRENLVRSMFTGTKRPD